MPVWNAVISHNSVCDPLLRLYTRGRRMAGYMPSSHNDQLFVPSGPQSFLSADQADATNDIWQSSQYSRSKLTSYGRTNHRSDIVWHNVGVESPSQILGFVLLILVRISSFSRDKRKSLVQMKQTRSSIAQGKRETYTTRQWSAETSLSSVDSFDSQFHKCFSFVCRSVTYLV